MISGGNIDLIGATTESDNVLLQTSGTDKTTRDAAKNLAGKHPGDTTQYVRSADGSLVRVAGEPVLAESQGLKVQVVGHGDAHGETIGGAGLEDVGRIIDQISEEFGYLPNKVTLNGCKTNACLALQLQEKYPHIDVRGFDQSRAVGEDGRKFDVPDDDPRALAGRRPPAAHGKADRADTTAHRSPTPEPDYVEDVRSPTPTPDYDVATSARPIGTVKPDGTYVDATYDQPAVVRHPAWRPVYNDASSARPIDTGNDGYLLSSDLNKALKGGPNRDNAYEIIDELAGANVAEDFDGYLLPQDTYDVIGAGRPARPPVYNDATSARPIGTVKPDGTYVDATYDQPAVVRHPAWRPVYNDASSARPIDTGNDGYLLSSDLNKALKGGTNRDNAYESIDELGRVNAGEGSDGYLLPDNTARTSDRVIDERIYATIEELDLGAIETDAGGYQIPPGTRADRNEYEHTIPRPDYAGAANIKPVATGEDGYLTTKSIYEEVKYAGRDIPKADYDDARSVRPKAPNAKGLQPPPRTVKTQQPVQTHRVIVQTGKDSVSREAAGNLAQKHSDQTTQYVWRNDGTLRLLAGLSFAEIADRLKVQVVGHGKTVKTVNGALGFIGGAGAADVAGIAKTVAGQFGKTVDKITLTGCDTAGCLASEVRKQLPGVEVKGFSKPIAIGEDGRKIHNVDPRDPRALTGSEGTEAGSHKSSGDSSAIAADATSGSE